MPRGQNPNSKKALAEHGKATQFKRGESAVRAAKRSNEVQAAYKSFAQDLKERCTPERMARINDQLIAMAEGGSIRAYELILRCIGSEPTKLDIDEQEARIAKLRHDVEADKPQVQRVEIVGLPEGMDV